MDLAQDIRSYYLEHFSELPEDKQFHFASRLASWNKDKDCLEHLQKLKPWILPPDMSVQDILKDVIEKLPKTTINAAEIRQPYFEKYPELRGQMLALFRVRHLLRLYDIDIRDSMLSLISLEELRDLSDKLAQDRDAIRILSTYAVNYTYLVNDILFASSETEVDVENFYRLGESYDISNKDQRLLLIYLYTHCVIGDSDFYTRTIRENRKTVYARMLQDIERLIKSHFNEINLDNKLEFLVCCRMMGYQTELFEQIYSECRLSLSQDGTFLIDKVNAAKQLSKTSFASSEHRNVLFIMSSSEYAKV